MEYRKKHISSILRADKTVFTFKDIALIWGVTDQKATIAAVNYYVKTGQLYRIRRGIYAKDKNYNSLELAGRIFTPSYISFETSLTETGVVFQYYNRIFVASYITRDIVAGGHNYSYKRIKDEILTHTAGVEMDGHYAIASPERAFLDVIYLNTEYYFDNLLPLDWDKVRAILPIYGGNKRMEKTVNKHYEALKSQERVQA